jgi:hypothetical protein
VPKGHAVRRAAPSRRRRPAARRQPARGTRPDHRRRQAGRERDDETILFWHRGLATSDIALGCALLDKAKRMGRGQTLRFQ